MTSGFANQQPRVSLALAQNLESALARIKEHVTADVVARVMAAEEIADRALEFAVHSNGQAGYLRDLLKKMVQGSQTTVRT